MGADANIKTIRMVYEAFGRGDVGAISDVVADDVDWATEASGTGAPWYGPHRGRDGVAAFFRELVRPWRWSSSRPSPSRGPRTRS